MEPTLKVDELRQTISIEVDGRRPYVAFRPVAPGVVEYHLAFVPPDMRHRGLGARVVAAAVEVARERGWRIVPTCPFVDRWLREHPDHGVEVA